MSPAATKLPDPTFETLVDMLAAPALVALGAYVPEGQQKRVDLPNARLTIELLRLLRDRTAAGRSDAESKHLEAMLDGLQRTYVAVAQREKGGAGK
jgi:hypothetical protein